MTFNYCRFSDTILSLQSSIFVFFRQFFNLPLCEQMRATWDLSLPWLDISVQTPFWSKMGEKGKKTTANFLFQLFEKKFPFFSERASRYECRSIIIWRRNWSLSTKVLCSLFYYPHPLSFYPHFLQFKSSRPSIVRHLKIIFWQLELIKGMMIAFLQSKLLHNCTIWYKKRTKIDCWLECVNDCTEKCPFSGWLCRFPFRWIIERANQISFWRNSRGVKIKPSKRC